MKLYTTLILATSLFAGSQAATTPAGCFPSSSASNAASAISCLHPFTVPKETWSTLAQYNAAALTSGQETDYLNYIGSILTATQTNSPCPAVPGTLTGFLGLATLTGSQGCIIYETTITSNKFTKGLPIFIAHSRNATSRFVHFSAPHPIADDQTNHQAAAVFDNTGGRTLIVAGRHRDAYTDVIAANAQSCNQFSVGGSFDDSTKTDAAHHDAELFHKASLRIRQFQDANGLCPDPTCAYIQFHGMGATTCSETVFISAGINNIDPSGAPPPWYTTTAAARANRFRTQVINAATGLGWTVNVPGPLSTCSLVATTNIFGRVLNGVAIGDECDHPPTYAGATGQFISVEQKIAARNSIHYGTVWRNAIIGTINTSCAPGKVPSGGVCV